MRRCAQCGRDNRDSARFCNACGNHLHRVGPLTSGELLHGRYLITRVIGHGGMGSIYQAKDTSAGDQLVAIKTFPKGSAEVERQFVGEAELLANLDHVNIPKVSDFFTEGGKHYIVMEYVPGETLEHRLARQGAPCSEQEVRAWAWQLGGVLAYLHSQNPPVIFRDLKPANLMITPQGQVKLIDFGIARFFKPGKTGDTQQMGTPGYAPPEQYGQGAQTDERSDIYSLGVVLHEALTRYDPASTPFKFPPVRQLNPAVSADLEQIIARATQSNMQQRYQDAAELLRALSVGNGLPSQRPYPDLKAPPMQPMVAPAPPASKGRSVIKSISEWLRYKRPNSRKPSTEPSSKLPRIPPEPPQGFVGSGGLTESKPINRFPDVTFPERVVLHERSTLRVAITQQPVRVEVIPYVMNIRMPVTAESVAVDVLVTAEDFDIIGTVSSPLVVRLDRDSDPMLFTLIPRVLGEKRIKVEFFQEGRYIGGVTAITTVVQPALAFGAKPVSAQGVVGLQTTVSSPDLTILITESWPSSDHMQYSFRLHSPAYGLFFYPVREPLTFSGSPSRWIEGLYRELETLGPQVRPSDIAETLATIGSGLYENLFPLELKEIWSRRLRGRVRSIQIISDEPWIPWEIIRPSCENETGNMVEDGFLCEDYVLTRWMAGPPPPSAIRISHGAVIAPVTANLPNVQREVVFVKGMPGSVEEVEPSLVILRGLLKTGGFQLLHFACHGSFDPADYEQSAIHLQGGDRLRPRDIAGERRNFGKDAPLVFVNACHTARGDFSLVGIGSWADKFVSANSSGFLGTSWAVDDTLAYKFCTVFYGALLQGKLIGEAMREARIVIKDAGDPTWLAYTLYADPLARVIFG